MPSHGISVTAAIIRHYISDINEICATKYPRGSPAIEFRFRGMRLAVRASADRPTVPASSGRLSRGYSPAIRNVSDIFLHSDLGRRQGLRVQGGSHVSTRRSPWSHQSPSMRGLSGLNPRNIHTGAPTRYYRGIIQTYLYPSPMTADMTCDRLRYRLHDMPRSPSSF